MRFLGFVLALIALMSGVATHVKADSHECGLELDLTNNEALLSDCHTPNVHFQFLTGSSSTPLANKHAVNKLSADRDFLLNGWTQIHVASEWSSSDPFDSLYIEKKDTVTNQWVATGLFKANFYGSHKSFASAADIEANIAKLTLLSKAAVAVGQKQLTGNAEDGDADPLQIHLNYKGAAPKYWPQDPAYGPASLDYDAAYPSILFPFLFVKIVGYPTDPDTQGNIRITLASNNGGNPPCTTPGGCGDPQFVGLQGQSFQFHGMADEVFSLVSAPEMQINALFKFISSGNCNYNDTMCWTHPGTYLGQIGIQYANDKILLQSGSHDEGMKVFINDKQVTPSKHIHQFASNSNSSAMAQFKTSAKFTFNSDKFFMTFHNSDYFFNFDFGLKDSQILQAGARPMRITGEICERESRMHKVLAETKSQIKAKLAATYPAYPLHGLVGQTWRNAEYCGRYFEGTVDDYVVGSLFGNEHTFNYFSH